MPADSSLKRECVIKTAGLFHCVACLSGIVRLSGSIKCVCGFKHFDRNIEKR